MKVEELQIGDWVYSSFSDKPCRVTSIELLESDYANVKVTGVNVIKDINSLTPIPLTPKILEKNGFEDIGNDTWQLNDRPYWFWVDFYNHRYGCEFDTSTYENEDSERRLYLYGVPCVHELQHALRLCGIEKAIEL